MNRREMLALLGVGGLVTTAAADEIKIEYSRGFDTARSAEHFRAYWESVKDEHKMKGNVSDHLTTCQIDSTVMLEVHIAIALDSRDPDRGLRDELLGFMVEGNCFKTDRLPDSFDKDRPLKYLVALFRTKKGDYGLITRYKDFAVVELNGRVGVAPHRDRK
jgi:hypothetical protein